jgi:Arc/MetJ family transcription regulator
VRTNIEIDDQLMEQAFEASGLPTKKAVVEEALRQLVTMSAQRRLVELAGHVEFFDGYDPEEDADAQRDEWDEPVD